MVRGVKKKQGNHLHDDDDTAVAEETRNPEAEERKRLKKLALTRNMLSETMTAVKSDDALSPSKTVLKHHGKDILRKSQRKNRFLFSFPGLLGPISGGKIGELKDLGTKNPILYLDFPQGQMKLFGTIVYPKNRYLTLQFSRGGKNVMCEDYFDNMIVFSDAWWIGKKDENPEELRLDFPKELKVETKVDYDFKGGAGATSDKSHGVCRPEMKHVEEQSPKHDLEEDLSDSQDDSKRSTEVTATRHSTRTSGKTFNFAEPSSGDDFVDGPETSEEEEKVGVDFPTRNLNSNQSENHRPIVFDIDDEDEAERTPIAKKVKASAPIVKSASKSEGLSQNHGSLVQATISTLFKKVEEKVGGSRKRGEVTKEEEGMQSAPRKKKIESVKAEDSVKVYQRKDKNHILAASGPRKRRPSPVPVSNLSDPNKSSQAEDDDIEEFSSSSEDIDASDEDWAA